jgi:glycosyltransferase involved in cell wall biosynthesis
MPQGLEEVLSPDVDLVVFCHLRWEFVTQRPQHLISRIGEGRKVLFVEEPIGPGEGMAKEIQINENFLVIQPQIEGAAMNSELAPIVQQYMKKMGIEKPIVWMYSAMFSEAAQEFDCSLLVYDCMDELSAFRGAPVELIQKERDLLGKADVVFTGGKSLFEAKQPYTTNGHCFPSSVDRAHFEKAFRDDTKIPEDISSLSKPVIGFYGVIDERIDLSLLETLAKARPEISWVMIGPVVKLTDEEIPKASNLHYLGAKAYADLPAYLKGMDITMMPFALNESTKFISPTKTLEYMAANKPIISTPIKDVVRDYSDLVKIVETPEQFLEAVDYYLKETDDERFTREAMFQSIIEKNSWDMVAYHMKRHMAEALESDKN